MNSRWNHLRAAILLASSVSLLGACALDIDDDEEQLGVSQDELKKPKACPAIAIMCIEGYRPKQLPNCNQICVPDHGFECQTDTDCGPIYCITTPCPQPVCRGHECVVPSSPPQPGGGGPKCGDHRCVAGNYCCNPSCGICAPPDGFCIQVFCSRPDYETM